MIVAKIIIVLFGVFLIGVGFLMLLAPAKAREILRKAGSTNLINYAEITIRLIPAFSMFVFADYSRYPFPFKLFGAFMFGTSIVLYFVPRRIHHAFSVKSAEILKPLYFQLISPFSMLFGGLVIYGVW